MLDRVRSITITAGVIAWAALAAQPALAHHAAAASHAPDDAAKGLVTADLVQATEPRCRGLLMGARSGVCTHGPDPAPAGRDVRAARSTAELRAERRARTGPVGRQHDAGHEHGTHRRHGRDRLQRRRHTGKRVEVLYVRPSDKTDRFASIKDALGSYVVRADRQLNASARETSGSRHWRFVTDPDPAGVAPCVLRITKVDVGSAEDDSFDAMVTAVKSRGFNRADRKYLMFGESNVYCGIGSIYSDSQPGQANTNNGSYAQYARADSGCWNYAEAHELMHNLGGVQTNAPNATPGFHCSDEADEMCYDDDGSGPVVMRTVCSGRDGSLFDCNHDDYFLAGTPLQTNYLATHWNTATSAFLIDPGFVPDTTAPAPPAGVTATPGAGQITVSWTANGEADLAGYRVLRNGAQIASLGKVTSYVDSGLLLHPELHVHAARRRRDRQRLGRLRRGHRQPADQDDDRVAQRVVPQERDLGDDVAQRPARRAARHRERHAQGQARVRHGDAAQRGRDRPRHAERHERQRPGDRGRRGRRTAGRSPARTA